MLLPQGDHFFLLARRRLPGTLLRTTAALHHRRYASGLLVASVPAIACGARNPKLPAQRSHRFLPARRPHHKLHSLLVHIRSLPRHRFPASWPRTLSNSGVTDVLIQTVTDVLRSNSFSGGGNTPLPRAIVPDWESKKIAPPPPFFVRM